MSPNDERVRGKRRGAKARPNGAPSEPAAFDETRLMRPALDLDEVEALEADDEARAGFWATTKRIFSPVTRQDARVYRRLFQYVRPYWYKVGFAVFLSVLTAVLVVAQLTLIHEGISVIEGSATADSKSPFEKLKGMFATEEVPTEPAPTEAGEGALPEGEAVAPGGEAVAPGGEAAAPGGEAVAPGGEAAAPGGEAAAPGGEAVAPGGEAAAPGGEAAAPGGEAAAPGGEAAAPGGEAAAPGSTTPAAPDTAPAEKPPAEAEAAEPEKVKGPPLSPEQRRNRLGQVVLIFFGVILTGSLLKYVQSLVMASTTRKVIRRLREDTFKNLVRLPLRFHQSTHSGKIVARVTKDINRLRDMLIGMAITGSKEICIFIGALWFMLAQSSVSALFAVAFVLVAILPIRIIADKIRHRTKADEAGSGDMFAILSEALAGQKVVKTFSGEGYEIKRFKNATRSIYKKQMETYRLRALTEPAIDIVGGVGIALALWVLGTSVISGDLLSATLVALVFALQKLNASVRKLGKLQNDFVRGIACGGRVTRILDQTPEIKEHPDAVPLERFEREIVFDDVRFQYQEDVPVLRGVSLAVKKGETVAIVGPSGSGKTSLVDLLPRLYDIDGGAITIDGKDLRDLTLKSLRSHIGTVTQETILFRDTIRENIAYGLESVSDEAIEEAARAANAHEFIAAKPNGYDTEMGERGMRLSGGERQRIAIARALLKNPPILILDEATSALDAESEASVQAALDRLMRGRTTLVIAHRLATIRRADRIVVLVKGEIQEMGTHDELLAKNGRYAKAYRMQTDAVSRGEDEGPIDRYFAEPSA